MRTFDIFVDRRLIQGDLIVVNLPIRDSMSAYYYLNINSEIAGDMLANAFVLPAGDISNTVLDADAKIAVEKYEVVDARPIIIEADAEFKEIVFIGSIENGVELRQELHEVSNKFERASSAITIGTDKLATVPIKAIGNIQDSIVLDVDVSETKTAFVTGDNGYKGLAMVVTLDPVAEFYERAESSLSVDATVRSLGYLFYLRVVENRMTVDVDPIDAVLLNSLGKIPARIAVGADVSFLTEYFSEAGSDFVLDADAETTSNKLFGVDDRVALGFSAEVVLRGWRSLKEVDELGTFADIDDMSLEDISYKVIEQ